MKGIYKEYRIKSRIEKVWDALTNPKTINLWSVAKAKMSEKVKDEFSLWGGDMYGKNVKVVKNSLLEQEWWVKGWEKPSTVVFELSEDGEYTVVKLSHTDLPEDEIEEYSNGWDLYYMGEIKKLLEKN